MENIWRPGYNEPMTFPRARKTSKSSRRFTVIYCALHSLRSREIIHIVGTGDHLPQAGEDNAFLQELADIVDEALQREVERQRAKDTP